MRFRSEPADHGKVFQDSAVAIAVRDGQGSVYTWYGVIESILLTHTDPPGAGSLQCETHCL